MWYKNIKTVFLGKSIPPKGGQNPIEPAKNGCVILSGRMSNFKEIEKEMIIKKCILPVKNNLFHSLLVLPVVSKEQVLRTLPTDVSPLAIFSSLFLR